MDPGRVRLSLCEGLRGSEYSRLGRTVELLRRRGEEKETYCQADGRCWTSDEPLDMYGHPGFAVPGIEVRERCMRAGNDLVNRSRTN
jgi:hypothetical protein